jgi:hypothetical protein
MTDKREHLREMLERYRRLQPLISDSMASRALEEKIEETQRQLEEMPIEAFEEGFETGDLRVRSGPRQRWRPSVAAQQKADDDPDPKCGEQSDEGLLRREVPNPVYGLSIGVLCSACRPVHLTAHLCGGITRYGTDGILHLAADAPGSALNAIFIHALILLVPPQERRGVDYSFPGLLTRSTI